MSKLKLSKTEATKSTLNLNVLQQRAAEPLFVIDSNGRVAVVNKPLLQLMEVSERALIGRLPEEVFSGAAEIVSTGKSGVVRFCTSTGKQSQALLSMELISFSASTSVIIGTLRQVAPVATAEPQVQQTRSASLANESAAFNNAMRARLKAQGTPYRLTAGRIQFIGLEEIKGLLDSRSPAQAARAMEAAKAIVRRRLSDNDTFTERDDAFIICFADLSAEEARVKAEHIAREIRERLIGEEDTRCTVHSQAEELCVDEQDIEEESDLIATLVSQLDAARAQWQQETALSASKLLQNARLELSPLLTRTLRPSGLSMARIAGDYGQAFALIDGAKSGLKTIFELDSLLLGLALKYLYQALPMGKRPTLIVPVNYTVLHDRKFLQSYLSLCQRIDQRMRRHLAFELVGVARDVVQSRLREILSCLAPFSAYYVLRAPGLDQKFAHLTSLDVAIVSVGASSSHVVDPNRCKAFLDFVSVVHKRRTLTEITSNNRCKVLVRDVPDLKIARWYSARGADLVSIAGSEEIHALDGFPPS